MPIYEYECEQCGVRFERLQRMAEEAIRECPECNGHVHRVMQPVGVIFKGSGFYVTDNRGKSSTGIPAPKKGEHDSAGAVSESTATTNSEKSEKSEKSETKVKTETVTSPRD
jgi:putative FmdB family regulatory protein